MVITTISGKNQTTIGKEFVDFFGLKRGTKIKQSRVDTGILIEPIGNVMSAFGSLKSDIPMATIKEETEAAERSMADEAMESMRHE